MCKLLWSGPACVAALVVCCAAAFTQPAPTKPGPEHERLKQMEGNWEASIKTSGGDTKGTMTYKMDLGGLWLIEDFKADFGGAPFLGRGLSTYDAAKMKYVTIWVDSTSTSHMVAEGTFDKDGKVQTMVGKMPGADGKMMEVKMTTMTKDKDTMIFTMSGAGPDGKDFEMMKVTYRRKK